MAQPLYQDRIWYSADGLRLHYRDYAGDPTKAPVLCIPGLTRNARDFEGVASHLAGSRRVIAVDLRGRGDSDYSDDPMTYVPPVYVQDLLALIDEQDLHHVVLFGTSLGGLLAMLIGLAARPLLAGVLLNDIGPVLGVQGLSRIRTYVGRDVRFAGWDEAAATLAQAHTGSFPSYGSEDWQRWAHRVCRQEPDGTIRFDYDMALAAPFNLPPPEPPFDLWPAFESLRGLPLLLVRGALSDILEEETAIEMVRHIPNMDFVTVPAIGHTPTLEEPEAMHAIDLLLAAVDHE
ncbi:alpha/beta fold hydrolase [Sphingomonas sp.]|uniref:alpha/beta fold hydrolase n=1 Tax=Sphingomonas sp. TaxID=28214 RepID=UPI003B3BD676